MDALLFYDDEYHAIRAAVEDGRGYKETAAHHRPNPKSPDDEEAKIVAAIDSASGTLNRAIKALEVLQRRGQVRAV